LKNPFRYRSYYYDFETNLYYLNSRYYDPETGRFVNADDIGVLTQAKDILNGLNLYSYCNNNPVNFTDENGKILLELKYGKYYVVERKPASEDYILNTEKIYFEICKENETVPVTMTNEKVKIDVPQTGAYDNHIVDTISFLLILLGIGAFIYDKKKK